MVLKNLTELRVLLLDFFRNCFSLSLDMDSTGSPRALVLMRPPKLSAMAGNLSKETGGFRRGLLLLAFITTSAMNASDQDLEKLLQDPAVLEMFAQSQKFSNELKKYYAHPAWTVKMMSKLQPEAAMLVFNLLIEDIVSQERRWHYLYDDPKLFVEDEKDINSFIEHLEGYYYNFRKIALDLKRNKLVSFEEPLFYRSEFEVNRVSYLPFITFLTTYMADKVQLFYATYVKYLSLRFVNNVKTFSGKKTESFYNKLNKDLSSIIATYQDYIRGSKYDSDVARIIVRYQNILFLVKPHDK